FDSGSMPYGQVHYPFDFAQGKPFEFPAKFIAEGLDQTRAWFYYLHVLAGALFGKNAFQNVIVNGIVLAEDGKKMSKKLQNYPDPMEIVEKYGADALRYYLLSSPVVQAENLNFSEKGVDEAAKKHVGRLMNVLAFYELYKNETSRGIESTHVLDRWILARLDQLIREVTKEFEAYRLDTATRPIGDFIDDLSTWYLRRSRERFKEDTSNKAAALATLRYVLNALSLVMAPSMPFLAEHIFQAVREEEDEESVHLATWPEGRATLNFLQRIFGGGGEDKKVLEAMSLARSLVSKALEARDSAKIKVRQPLQKLTIDSEQLAEEFLALIRDEVNVKQIVLGKQFALDTNITNELREEGAVRDTIRLVQDARKAAKLHHSEHGKVSIQVPAGDRSVVEKNLGLIEKETNTKISII
ncbi:class I tRNA ligase family protein, partial [Candidatus Kaiserbacteria bacterium]|nr:class I tRNA ligase family protein [Candidatus Kaiserbacteria bacterium]